VGANQLAFALLFLGSCWKIVGPENFRGRGLFFLAFLSNASRRLMRLLSFLIAMVISAAATRGATFTVDPQQSSITLSGTVAGAPLSEQGPGSLTSRITGTLDASTSAGQLLIASGTLDFLTNGVWQPAAGGQPGSAPADFGANAQTFFGTTRGAFRDIVVQVSAPARALQAGGQFDAAAIAFALPTNSSTKLDYSSSLIGTGSTNIQGVATNKAATTGTVTGTTGSQVITINVDATYHLSILFENDTELNVKGQIIARQEGGPGGDGPRFSKIEVSNNQVRLTVMGAAATARLRSSTDLKTWQDKQAQVTTVDANTKIFIVPVSGPKEFYQTAQ
jgi:hypothetical protein